MRRFHVSLVPPDVEAPALVLPFKFVAKALAPLLKLPAAASVSAAEMPSPLVLLFRAACALGARSRLDESKRAAIAVAPMVLVRTMELETVGEVGAVYDPLANVRSGSMEAENVAEGVLPSAPEENATSGSLKVEARGVRGAGEGWAENVESDWSCMSCAGL